MSPLFRPLQLSRARRAALFAVGLGLAACGVSPSLPPLPPPDEPGQFSTVREGLVVVSGNLPVDRAKVYVLNPLTNEIFGQFAQEPRYSIEVEAQADQFLFLWYSVGGVDSDSVGFELSKIPEVSGEVNSEPLDAGL